MWAVWARLALTLPEQQEEEWEQEAFSPPQPKAEAVLEPMVAVAVLAPAMAEAAGMAAQEAPMMGASSAQASPSESPRVWDHFDGTAAERPITH